ncbi:MAG: hypothetical protein LBE80_02550, partial [Deltaproteobacteria bacterium]|nr:hypothetical protein [Deltaproteobacteria bacterium]
MSLLFSFDVLAQSFNCQKASTVVEKEICSDYQLGLLDTNLGIAYKQAINTPGIDKNYVTKSQRQFIMRREGCAVRSDLNLCIGHETSARIDELTAMVQPFLPKGQGQGQVSSLTGRFLYRAGAYEGDITITELPGSLLSLDYGSIYSDQTCSAVNLTIPKSEA